jgi:hypothetical protein
VPWPPAVGEPLPRAQLAWYSLIKWTDWILAPHGHGEDWATVFHVGIGHVDLVWDNIVIDLASAPIVKVRTAARGNCVCGVELDLTINARRARVMTAWHYAHSNAAPRLVTAYPRT